MQLLELTLAAVSLFTQLRPDELGRIARHFECITLRAGDEYIIGPAGEPAKGFVVIAGRLTATIKDPLGELRLRLGPGDRYGDSTLLTGQPQLIRLVSLVSSQVALLDRQGLDAILTSYPVVALTLVAELATELRSRDDQVRRISDLRAAGATRAQDERAVAQLRRSLLLRSSAVRHVTITGLFRRLVVDQGSEPPFWMLVGFGLGLAGSRVMVHLILKYHLEKHLFALVAGSDPNPIHIHHFNYGLIVVATTGLLALSPYGRRSLRTLALLFGLGCALVFDEFALFWNLNPDYSQGLSLISAAIAASVLIQLAFFRRFWHAVFARVARLVAES